MSKRLFSKIFLNSALSEMLKILIYILCDNYLTVQDKKVAMISKCLKKCEGTVVKISAQSEHFSVLVLKGTVQRKLRGVQNGINRKVLL
jgi:hypothetical protein